MLRCAFKNIHFSILIFLCAGACAPTPPLTPETYYYLSAEMTYLRDAPAYEANVVGQLYKGDQVVKLESNRAGWGQVRSGRTGQTGWVPEELLSLNPVPLSYYFVTRTVQLRECANPHCPPMQLLSRGDQVQKIEQNGQGWWRVLAAKSRNIGWLPAALLSERLEEPPARIPDVVYYYVAVRALRLRQQPLENAPVIKNLALNDQVQKLEQNPLGWTKVREPASGAVGWVLGRYLQNLPVTSPPGKKPAKKPRELKPKKPEKAKEEALPEPEVL